MQPRRSFGSIAATARAGIPWAADNDAYGGFGDDEAARFERMLAAIARLPGCLFVTAPDVVGDAAATARHFEIWAPRMARYGVPIAYVLQDGATSAPWDRIAAVFVGGTDRFKLSPDAAALVDEAKRRGKWAHLGRVNSRKRTLYAKAIGCDSIDGTGTSIAPDTNIPLALGWVREAAPPASWQLPLDV